MRFAVVVVLSIVALISLIVHKDSSFWLEVKSRLLDAVKVFEGCL